MRRTAPARRPRRAVAGLRAAATASGLLVAALHTPAAADESVPKWSPWVEFGGYYGSDNASRGEAALFAPLWQNDRALLFADIRGKLFERNVREGNFALGFRHMLPSGWNVGIWGGYDVRRSQFGSTFPQMAGGVELLRDNVDLRVNGYLPLKRETTLASATTTSAAGVVALTGGGAGIAMTTTTIATTTVSKELALWGVDGEVGARLFGTDPAAAGLRMELRAYAGGFYFDHADLPGQVAGPRGRLELRFDDLLPRRPGSRLTVEGEASYDDVRKDKWEVGARLRIPFGAAASRVASLTPQERRMTEALERDTDIVSQSQTTSTSTATTIQENVLDNATDVALNQVVNVNATNPGDINTAPTNTLIIADGGAGNLAGARTLPGNTTLMGGSGTIAVRGATSGAVANFTAPGARPTLSGAGNARNLTLNGDNVHVAGLDIAGSGNVGVNFNNFGIIGNDRTNVVVGNVAIDGTGRNGIRIGGGNPGTWTVADTTISNADQSAALFIMSNKTVTITGLTIDAGTTDEGITIFLANNTVSLSNSTLVGAFDDSGIVIQNGPNTLSGTGNTAAGATFGGQFCFNGGGAQNGSFAFLDTGVGAPGTCP